MQVEEMEKIIDSNDSIWINLWPSLMLITDYQIHAKVSGDLPNIYSTVFRMVLSEIDWQDRFEGNRSISKLKFANSIASLRADWLTLRNRRSLWKKTVDPDSLITYRENDGSLKTLKAWEGIIEMISFTQFYRGQLAIQMSQLSISSSSEQLVVA